jgi:threonine/homoserine/homoserine lactone efflux protein
MLLYAIQGIGYALAAVAQPGPFQTYIISQALRNGWRRTLIAALAPLISDGPIIVLVLLVLTQIPETLRRFLYIAGGLFVLYLAWGAFRAWRDFDTEPQQTQPAGKQSLLRAALMNALSPGPWLFWSLATGPILLRGWSETPAYGLGFLGGFYVTLILGLALLILLFGLAAELGPKFNRVLLGVSAIALSGFGIYQLWLGLHG